MEHQDVEAQASAETTTGTTPSGSDSVGGRFPNLRPPWKPGQSGNPSGLAKDGLSAKEAPLRRMLRAHSRRRRNLKLLVETWWEAACCGDSQAREQILKRLDPITEDPTAGRTVLTGIKLELTPGGASLTMGQATAPNPLPAHELDDEGAASSGG